MSITMTTATLKKTKYLIGVSYIFRRMWWCKYMTHVYCASWGQKRAGFPGSVLQVVVSHLIWVLDTKFWSSGVARIALNCWATFPVPHLPFLVDFIKGEFFINVICFLRAFISLLQSLHMSYTHFSTYKAVFVCFQKLCCRSSSTGGRFSSFFCSIHLHERA